MPLDEVKLCSVRPHRGAIVRLRPPFDPQLKLILSARRDDVDGREDERARHAARFRNLFSI
jgi:hypothetical protein